MPQRSTIHRPPFARSRDDSERQRKREHDRHRPNATQRGYDAEWEHARKAYLADNPICSHEGCTAPAIDVDHIESIRDRPDLRLDPSNWRGLCRPHHSARTARDQGFARKDKPVGERGARYPAWLRPSRVPFTLVCGPPGSGKSRMVRKAALALDLVLDLNEIMAELSGLPLYTARDEWVDPAIRLRNSRLGTLSAASCQWQRACLTAGEPRAKHRAYWQDRMKATRIIVLAIDAATCIDRLRTDVARASVLDHHVEAVKRWWDLYEPRPGDIVMRG